jgi:hypothetical protein
MPVKISQLPASTNPPNTADLLPIVQGGVTKQTTLGALFTQLLGFLPSGTAPTYGWATRTAAAKMGDVVSIKDFKTSAGVAVAGDGIQDDYTGIQAALDWAKARNGATIWFPRGTYLCTAQLSLGGTQGIVFKGETSSSQLTGGATITYNGTATPFIYLGTPTAIAGLILDGVNIQYTNAAFTGTLVKVVATQYQLKSATLTGNGVSGALYLLDNDASTEGLAEEVVFDKAQYAIAGQKSDGTSSCNGFGIRTCTFNGGITVADIRNPGQGWDIDGGTVFENIANLKGQAILMDAACSSRGLNISGAWMGDATANGAWAWITWQGTGLSVKGSYINGTGFAASTAVKILGTSSGVEVSGNRLSSHSIGVDIGASLVTGCSIHANDYTGTATKVSGTPVADFFTVQSGSWTPAWTNLTVVLGAGTVAYDGRYIKIGQMVKWRVQVSTTGGATTASSAGSTNINNMPFNAAAVVGRDTCTAVDGSTGASLGVGLKEVGNALCYTPTWAATSDVIVISGSYHTDS